MISQYQKFELNTNSHKLKIEANYNDDVKPCKKIKITLGEEGGIMTLSAEIDKHDLYALLMLYADEKEMEQAITINPRKMMTIKKMMKIKTLVDRKAGEEIVFPIEYEVTEDVGLEWERLNKERMLSEEKAKDKLK